MPDEKNRATLHREDIKAAIRKRFGTLTAYAETKDVSVSALSHYLNGKTNSRSLRIEKELAADFGWTLVEVQSATRPEAAAKPCVASGETSGETSQRPPRLKIAGRSLNGRNAA